MSVNYLVSSAGYLIIMFEQNIFISISTNIDIASGRIFSTISNLYMHGMVARMFKSLLNSFGKSLYTGC